jgi:hypothetical protein
MLHTYRQFRPAYNGPSYRDIACSIVIRMLLSTGFTLKYICTAQSFLPTLRAILTGICWIHQFNRDPYAFRFIRHKLLELIIAPAGDHAIAMRIPNKRLIANATKLFHPDHSGVVPLSFYNKLFRKNVVLVSDSSFFISGKLTKFFLGASSSSGLQAGSYFGTLFFKGLPRSAARDKLRRSVSRIVKTQVNSNGPSHNGNGIRIFDHNIQVPIRPSSNQSCTSRSFSPQSVFLIFSNIKKSFFTSTDCSQRDLKFFFPKSEDSGIIFNAARSKHVGLWPLFLFLRQGIGNSPDGANNQICTQRKVLSNRGIDQLMQLYRILNLRFKCFCENYITRTCKYFSGLQIVLADFFRNFQLTANCSHTHGQKLYQKSKISLTEKERYFLPALKDWVSMPSIG